MGAPIDELQSGTGYQIADGARYEYLTGSGKVGTSRPDMDRDACDVITYSLHLTSVDTGSHLETMLFHQAPYLTGTMDGSRRTVESGQESVAGRTHLNTSKPRQLAADNGVVCVQQIPPGTIAQRGSSVR